ncbi:hypothetical protein LZ30DRAFT_122104 [Colletotrichum cereale]|nr:hypothetical protein LZ30DRAFT_122104 [Colletotrichum cereale]
MGEGGGGNKKTKKETKQITTSLFSFGASNFGEGDRSWGRFGVKRTGGERGGLGPRESLSHGPASEMGAGPEGLARLARWRDGRERERQRERQKRRERRRRAKATENGRPTTRGQMTISRILRRRSGSGFRQWVSVLFSRAHTRLAGNTIACRCSERKGTSGSHGRRSRRCGPEGSGGGGVGWRGGGSTPALLLPERYIVQSHHPIR